MANKITTLFEDSSKTNALYPRTKASAVSDSAGNSLENLLIYSGDSIEELTDPTIVASLIETSTMSGHIKTLYSNAAKTIGLFPRTKVQAVSDDTNKTLDQIITEIYEAIDSGGGVDMNQIYPVGSIYMSTNSTSPATLFGVGTWEQIQNRFLLSAGSTYSAGSTGGEATVTLDTNTIPSHSHSYTNTSQTWTPGGDYTACYRNGNTNTGGTGGGQAHNNMPPYLVVYMWKRTA